MASQPVSERLCEPCEKANKDVKARTLCYECHVLLCEPCSDYHQRLKSTKDHNLIELINFIRKSASKNESSTSNLTPSSVNEDELASDCLENVILREDTILYHGAQVAMEATSEKHTSSIQADPRGLKATKCLEFSVKRPEDKEKVSVTGVLCMSDKLVVVDDDNKVLKLFDQNGTYLSSTELKYFTWGITHVRNSTFATCELSYTVYLWTVLEQTIVSENVTYQVDHWSYGIHFNGTYYCLLNRRENAITILDTHGEQIRKIIMKEACGKKITFGWDVHMDCVTNNIYVPCQHEHGVLCTTIEGQVLWFTTLSSYTPKGITEVQGTLCLADSEDVSLHMITKEGEYVRKLVDKEDLEGKPENVFYGHDGRLYVSYDSSGDKHDKICVYTIT